MSRAPIGSSFFHAGAVVDQAGLVLSALHCLSANVGIGVYELTLEQGINAAECLIFVGFSAQLLGNTGDIAISVVHTSDTVKTVSILLGNPGVPANRKFDFTVKRIRVGV